MQFTLLHLRRLIHLNHWTSLSFSTIMSSACSYIDIGANLTDTMYLGTYHGSHKHEPDLQDVLRRARESGVGVVVVTGGSLSESEKVVEMCGDHQVDTPRLYCTVGCHPTRCNEFATGGDEYASNLHRLIRENPGKVVAVGECGLDYDRLHFCDKETQKQYFERQFDLAEESKLAMFLHNRNSAEDFLSIVRRNRDRMTTGVVHSFDGSSKDAESIVDLDLYIGINGCSLRTAENLEVIRRSVPVERILVETDSPWCEIKPTHSSWSHVRSQDVGRMSRKCGRWERGHQVKGRNEPGRVRLVVEVLASVLEVDEGELAGQIVDNTRRCFPLITLP